jgi:hypothetical protein
MSKKKKPAAVVAMEVAELATAEVLAEQKDADVTRAMIALRRVTDRGDINGTRVQAAQVLLRVHGVLDAPGSKTTVKAETQNDGKITVEVVHIEKPHAEDD